MNRRNNRRKVYMEDNSANRIMIISAAVLGISILAFFVTFFVYRGYLNRQEKIAQIKSLEIAEVEKNKNNEQTSKVSSGIGKTINEVQEYTKNINEIKENVVYSEKVAINTSNMEKENVASANEKNTIKNIGQESLNTNTVTHTSQNKSSVSKKQEKLADPTFKKPVDGEITVGFAKDTLIYSNTLQEWVMHNGIDIKAEKTTIVKASEEGTVKSIKNDPRYGITVVIEHVNGYVTVYSNLLTAEFIKEGEKVEQGQTIGTVGNTATFEIADEPHLHFEIMKYGEYLNPELYLK